jgi:hypothetical protein
MWMARIRRTPVVLHKRLWLFSKSTCSPSKQLGHLNEHWCSGAAPEQGRPTSGARAQAPEQRQSPEQSLDLQYVLQKEKRREKKRREEKGAAAERRSTGREERRGEE